MHEEQKENNKEKEKEKSKDKEKEQKKMIKEILMNYYWMKKVKKKRWVILRIILNLLKWK